MTIAYTSDDPIVMALQASLGVIDSLPELDDDAAEAYDLLHAALVFITRIEDAEALKQRRVRP